MNTKELIVDLEKKCVDLKHSDHKNKVAIIKCLEAAMAEIQKPEPNSGAITAETLKQIHMGGGQSLGPRRHFSPRRLPPKY